MPVTDVEIAYTLCPAEKRKSVAAVVVAAGSSTRMGGLSKQFLPLCGVPVLGRSLLAFQEHNRVNRIIAVCRQEDIADVQKLVRQYEITKLCDIVPGGATRAESVQKGLALCREELVAIHDGARPLVSAAVIDRVLEAAELYGAAACAVPVKDTVKQTDPCGKILSTPDRASLRLVQTPQAFSLELYRQAAADLGDALSDLTDDCAVLEAAGHPVYLVPGDYANIKITTPEDMALAEALFLYGRSHPGEKEAGQ